MYIIMSYILCTFLLSLQRLYRDSTNCPTLKLKSTQSNTIKNTIMMIENEFRIKTHALNWSCKRDLIRRHDCIESCRFIGCKPTCSSFRITSRRRVASRAIHPYIRRSRYLKQNENVSCNKTRSNTCISCDLMKII